MIVPHTSTTDLVEALAVPYRATAAYRSLLPQGSDALPAIRSGLRHLNARVRVHCCRFLDRHLDAETLDDLIALLDDPDTDVRVTILHTLACDRCKEDFCGQTHPAILPAALRLLRTDPSPHVRAMAIEVVGQYAHSNPDAATTIETVMRVDPSPAVRKKARWYAPGGPIYRRFERRQHGQT